MGRPKTKLDTITQVAKRNKERKTPKQIKFLNNLHNALAENKGLEKITYGKLLADSGYSKSIQENPQVVLEARAVRPELQKIVNTFVEVRDRAIRHITDDKLGDAPAKDLAQVADKFQKNINLLVGNATENRVTQSIKIDLTARD